MSNLLRISNDCIYDVDTGIHYYLEVANGDYFEIKIGVVGQDGEPRSLENQTARNLWSYLISHARDERTSAQRAHDYTAALTHVFEMLLAKLRFAAVEETQEEMHAAIKSAISYALEKQAELDEL